MSIYPPNPRLAPAFPTRRSVVHSTKGIVASTQPLASQCGVRILRQGGNAADAAVAVAAAINVTEPTSTGIGGDAFCLFYEAKTRKVRALNASGRSPVGKDLNDLKKRAEELHGPKAVNGLPLESVLSVTVPGAPAGWVDAVEKFGSGKVTLKEILQPAIELAEGGWPVGEVTSFLWTRGEKLLKRASSNFAEMLKKDDKAPQGCRAPEPGDLMFNRNLANTFRLLAENGKKGFYQGQVADAIIGIEQDLGGFLTHEDLRKHMETGSQEVDPISLRFRGQQSGKLDSSDNDRTDGSGDDGVIVWEHPPNGQGIVALMALGIIEELEKTGKVRKFDEDEHNCAEYLHLIVEALRIAFADANWWVTDPDVEKVPTQQLISREYLAERAKLFDPDKASHGLDHGSPAHNHCDTVYFAVTDSEGNAASFINSNYAGFGTGIVPKGCGFTLQNRGQNFDLAEGHPNVYAAGKRPYHTIIPAMVTNPKDNTLHSVYGVMGGFMQPQGHVQVLLNMLTFKHTPQTALDAPRMCLGAGTPDQGETMDQTVYLEEGIGIEVAEKLRAMGHKVEMASGYAGDPFGRGQVIRCHVEEGVLVYSGGSDARTDGAALPV